MLFFKAFVVAAFVIVNATLSVGLVPIWEQIGDCAQSCLSQALHAVLEDPAIGTHNEICPAPWFTVATGFITPQCRDFCADPCYHSTLERCLKIQCPRWVVGNIMLISNHIICNMTQRFYVKFSSDGQGHWEAHWPASLVPQGVETAISHGGNPWPVASFMTSTTSPTATVPTAENNHRRDLRAAFHAYPAADESTFPAVVTAPTFTSFPNATNTTTCDSITTATTVVIVTVTQAPSTNVSAATTLPSTSCNCSTSTFTSSVFTTVPAPSLPETVTNSSTISSTTHLTSFHSTTTTTTHPTTHATSTVSLPPMQTETGAAVAVGIKSKLLAIGAGGAGMFMIAML